MSTALRKDLAMRLRLDRPTVVAAFAAFAVFWGAWGAVIPQIDRAAHLTNGTLGLDLLLIGIGALCSMQFAGTLIDRLGPLVLPGSMIALGLAGILPALARSGVSLGGALFVVGAASGAFDVAINTAAARSEARTGQSLMNLAHAGFSIGVVVTSLSVGLALDRSATPLQVLVGCGIATSAVAATLTLLRHATAWGQPIGADAGVVDRLPPIKPPRRWEIPKIPRPLLILGAICGMAYLIEGTWQSWGALHIERTFHRSPALGPRRPPLSPWPRPPVGCWDSASPAASRLDKCSAAVPPSPRPGTALAAVAPSASLVLAGIAVAGLGTSICAPTVFSLTGRVADPANRGAAMGTVTTLAYVGFVIGPAFAGVLVSVSVFVSPSGWWRLLPWRSGSWAERPRCQRCQRCHRCQRCSRLLPNRLPRYARLAEHDVWPVWSRDQRRPPTGGASMAHKLLALAPSWCHNDAMDLRVYIEDIHRQLAAAAEAGGDEARALAERLAAPLDAAIRLALQDVLAAAAEEITCELAPGSVELRLRGRDPEFVVTPPPADEGAQPVEPNRGPGIPSVEADEGGVSRINLRLPDQLKARVEQAAGADGVSVNSWLVRAATSALDRADPGPRRPPSVGKVAQRYTGWAR